MSKPRPGKARGATRPCSEVMSPPAATAAPVFPDAPTILQTPTLQAATFDAYLSRMARHRKPGRSGSETGSCARPNYSAAHKQATSELDVAGCKARSITHDFNNSMQGIVSVLDFLQQKLRQNAGADVDRLIEAALTSADRAGKQIRAMLGGHGPRDIHTRAVDVNSLVRSIDVLIASLLGESIELRLLLSTQALLVRCDTSGLEAAVINLVLNARDAMPRGGRLLICTSLVLAPSGLLEPNSQRYASLRIMDTGCGMSADVLARAFEPCFSTRGPREGRGMGLWSVREFIGGLGGQIVIRSAENKGTSAELLFPL
jgi:signal transduction histidine kinase